MLHVRAKLHFGDCLDICGVLPHQDLQALRVLPHLQAVKLRLHRRNLPGHSCSQSFQRDACVKAKGMRRWVGSLSRSPVQKCARLRQCPGASRPPPSSPVNFV